MTLKIEYNESVFLMIVGIGTSGFATGIAIPFNMLILKDCGTWIGCSFGYAFVGIFIAIIGVIYRKLTYTKVLNKRSSLPNRVKN